MDYFTRPRDTGCMASYMGAGSAYEGIVGMAGMAGGPTVFVSGQPGLRLVEALAALEVWSCVSRVMAAAGVAEARSLRERQNNCPVEL